ncbi:DNA methylase N-4/N-6 domain-containing protein [Salinisphaera sp. T5B8]|uniref:site-specific DNA-methyltransferase n=1 Tax=Salinisphaera sp. T5B8 TaxID=1304154 RepID=UPI00334085A2
MDSRIRDAILAAVPDNGRTIGNKSLFQDVRARLDQAGQPAGDDVIEAARAQLITEGVLSKGRGRGGSVYLNRARSDADEANGASDADREGIAGAERKSTSAPVPGDESGDGRYGNYRHPEQATQRPDVGLQDQFPNARGPKTYRYDSSLAPELAWDESAERDFAEWLLHLITQAAEKGEAAVFDRPQQWRGSGERFESLRQCSARLQSLSRPFLNWAGKAERQRISVPTVPLFVHERQSTRAILDRLDSYRSAGQTLELFGDPQADITDKLDAYEHTGPWTNRMILGDSLQVMNSLLEYEGLGGQVQMIYIDPPYGVKFGSNFQPFVRKRDVTHGKDEQMIREPEMVKAYRDTWELGLHSYLSYLRDRLLLARELLTESGSVFVQISDENLHHVKEVCAETLGEHNFVAVITVRKTTSEGRRLLGSTCDYLIWYAKDISRTKYNAIYLHRADESNERYDQIDFGNGNTRPLTPDEKKGVVEPPNEGRIFRVDNLTSSRPAGKGDLTEYIYKGKKFKPGKGTFKTNEPGMRMLETAGRLHITSKGGLSYRRYVDDFGYSKIGNLWSDISGAVQSRSDPKIYAVQTSTPVIERCVLMATDPGDIIFDPTCGSGTAAYVAEQWGRRWITCDTSRVPLALARQRLLTANFPWYELKEPQRGPAGGFVYKRKQNRKGEEVGGLVPRITLKSIANNEEPEMVTLVDRPEQNKKITRVCGPFTVEATIQAAATFDETAGGLIADERSSYENPRAYLDRMVEVLRRAHTLRLPGNESLSLDSVRPLTDCEWLNAEATSEANGSEAQRIAVVFGPEEGAIHSQQVYEAAREAYFLKYDQLYLFGFAIQAKAGELASDRAKLRIPCTYINVTPDVVMADLLKTSHTDQIFSVTGLPDVALYPVGRRDDGAPLYQAAVRGLDIFRPDNLETESIAAENLPCWMLDTDYNGLVFCASQVFFPRTGAWDNLKKSLKADFDDSVWEHLAGTESEPFVLGSQRRIAVKVIDERGNELMAVREPTG